jgi:site-specific DNA-methyltransferase (adenine-specific)
VWKSFDDYLEDVEKWAIECKRILADNGCLFWFGDEKKIAYSQFIFDKYFKLENSLVWFKYNLRGGMFGSTGSDGVRSFPICSERLLFYSNDYEPSDWNKTGLERIMEEHIRPRHPFALYLKSEFEKAGKEIKEVRKFVTKDLGFDSAMINRWLEGSSIMKKEIYLKFRAWLNGEYLRKEYEDLRKEYEDLRRPFNNIFNHGEILKIPNFETKKYNHPTIKPEKLTSDLILVTTRGNDTVCVPFAGSGTECAMSIKHKRNFIGFDIDPNHVETATNRVRHHLRNPTLF